MCFLLEETFSYNCFQAEVLIEYHGTMYTFTMKIAKYKDLLEGNSFQVKNESVLFFSVV